MPITWLGEGKGPAQQREKEERENTKREDKIG
jgi:hypothetical protein